MRENLHRFFRAARGAGVRVSPAESIDAMRAVSKIGFDDRQILRDTLLVTLAKTQEEKRALGDCFDLFFSRPEPPPPSAPDNDNSDQSQDASASGQASGGGGGGESSGAPNESEQRAMPSTGGQPSEGLGPLAQMLLRQDRNEIAAAIADAASAASLPDIRYFTQRGIFSGRILEQMGIARLRDDLDALATANPALAERLRAALDGLREAVRDTVSQGLALYAREEAENLLKEIQEAGGTAEIK